MAHMKRYDVGPSGSQGTLEERFPRDARLISDLMNPDLTRRLGAQHRLITRGRDAVPALLEALQHDDPHVRNSAAHILAVIADPATAAALAGALEDEAAPVRWVAAEGLVALGNVGLKAALRALVSAETITPQLKDAVRHILLKMRDHCGMERVAEPVLSAMKKFEVDEMILVEAFRAISELENLNQDQRP